MFKIKTKTQPTAYKWGWKIPLLMVLMPLLVGCSHTATATEAATECATTTEAKAECAIEQVASAESAVEETETAFEYEDARDDFSEKDGIIVVSASYGSNHKYKSTGTYKFTPFTVDLDIIDPETGEVTHMRTFSSEDTHSCSAYLIDTSVSKELALRNFNSDMTLMTAYLTLESGAMHIGWVDENGLFTDVSEKITTESDFGALTNHKWPRFVGDYIYFDDDTNTPLQIKRVPLNNLTADAVEVVANKVTLMGLDLLPDGTVRDDLTFYTYYDSSMRYPVREGCLYDWISADTCIGGTDNYMIYKYQLSEEKDDWDSQRTPLIPLVKNRRYWSARVSPGLDQVAFLSKLESGTDQSPSLFLVSVDGGEPIKVNTNFSFGDDTNLIDWR